MTPAWLDEALAVYVTLAAARLVIYTTGSEDDDEQVRERGHRLLALCRNIVVVSLLVLARQWLRESDLSQPDRVIFAGGVLQLLGVVAVAWELHKVRQHFRDPTAPTSPDRAAAVLRSRYGWLRGQSSRIFRRRNPDVRSVTARTSAGATTRVSASVTTTWNVEALSHEIEQLRAELSKLIVDLGNETSRSVAAERAERVAQHEYLVVGLATGGMRLRVSGLVVVLVGITLSNWPHWIARHMAWLV